MSRARAFVVVMGVVALFGDMTYEGARGLAGPYLAMLGANAAMVGFVAGFGEFLGYGLRLVTGWLGDRARAYWPLVIAGYSVNLVAIPGLALVGSAEAAAALLFLERIGKAVRSPARSVLVSHAANAAGAGKSFGIEEALDQIGAVSGPLLTALAMWAVRGEPVLARYQVAFAVLLIPALCNLGFVLHARKVYPDPGSFEAARPKDDQRMGRLFRWYTVACFFLALGFADWALVAFHAGREGLVDPALLPVAYAGVMAVDAVAALMCGTLFDRHGLVVLAASVAISALYAPLVFLCPSAAVFAGGALCWAVSMGAQDSVFKAAIARMVPKEERGRAYGVFFAVFGFAWWIGSALMGWLYDRSLTAVVGFSMATQLMAAVLLLFVSRRMRVAGRLP